eukprot:3743794-Rhodomonas_salina.2
MSGTELEYPPTHALWDGTEVGYGAMVLAGSRGSARRDQRSPGHRTIRKVLHSHTAWSYAIAGYAVLSDGNRGTRWSTASRRSLFRTTCYPTTSGHVPFHFQTFDRTATRPPRRP